MLATQELTGADVVNEDAADIVDRLSRDASLTGTLRALDAVTAAEHAVNRNITPQLTFEVMLFDIRKAFVCR